MDILESLAREGEMTAAGLARETGLKAATVHNILSTLAGRDYLLNDKGVYRLGPALAALAYRGDPMMRLPRLAQEVVDEVTRVTGESSIVTVLAGFRAVMVATTPGTDEVAVQFPKGGWPNPLHLATGRLLVALGDESRWGVFIRRQLDMEARGGPAIGLTEGEWLRELEKVRGERRCSLKRAKSTASVAWPVMDRGGVVVAAVGASCPVFRADERHLRAMSEAVEAGAAALSRGLGWR